MGRQLFILFPYECWGPVLLKSLILEDGDGFLFLCRCRASPEIPRNTGERKGFSRVSADNQKPAALICDSEGRHPTPSVSDSCMNFIKADPSSAGAREQAQKAGSVGLA